MRTLSKTATFVPETYQLLMEILQTQEGNRLNNLDKHILLNNVSIVVIGLVALFVFLPATRFEFTNWDDNVLVTQNAAIRDVSIPGIIKIFSSFSLNHYHPLVTLSYAIEFKIFGLIPFPFHVTNVVLHVLNSILVVVLLRSITNNTLIAFVTGLLFAIHPLRVESVAWIAERKDVLSALFHPSVTHLLCSVSAGEEGATFYCCDFVFHRCPAFKSNGCDNTGALSLI